MPITCTKASLINGYIVDLNGMVVWFDPFLEDSDKLIDDSYSQYAVRPPSVCAFTSQNCPEKIDVLITTGNEHTHFSSFVLLGKKYGFDIPIVTHAMHTKKFKSLGFTSIYPVGKSLKRNAISFLTILGVVSYQTASYVVINNTSGETIIFSSHGMTHSAFEDLVEDLRKVDAYFTQVEFPIYSRFGISSLLFGPPNSTVNEHFDQIKELSMKRGLKCILPEHDLYSQLVQPVLKMSIPISIAGNWKEFSERVEESELIHDVKLINPGLGEVVTL